MKRRPSFLVAVLFMTACGGAAPTAVGPSSTSRSLATHSPASPGPPWPASQAAAPCAPSVPVSTPPLMAVLEANGPNASGSPRANGHHDTVAIADLGALARAKASFQPRIGGYVGGEWLSPNEAYVVRGTVYYIDGYGTVFRLGLNGDSSVVARFPVTLT